MQKKCIMKIRHILYIVLLLCCPVLLLAQQNGKAQKKAAEKKAYTVVIDAGHGGHDPGAIGKLVQEKKLNLDVALKLGKMIEDNYPEVKVFYTRKTDVFLTLQQRADFVNSHNADLFICIHTNAAENRSVSGAETFVLGIDKMQSNLDVAMRENAVMLLEENYQTAYEGFDPSSVDSYIMFELMQDQYIDQSLQFATGVQQQFCGVLNRADRGVRQAGFWVLHKSACPSVLVEMGFISNAEEEKFLASENGKTSIASAMYNAFVDYKAALDRRAGRTPGEPGKVEKVSKVSEVSKVEKVEKVEKAPAVPAVPAVPAAEKPVFRVQIFSTTRELPKNDATFKGLKGCQFTIDGKYYKYTYGEDADYETIRSLQNELKNKFKDCFIVAFLNGKQIPVKEAREMK